MRGCSARDALALPFAGPILARLLFSSGPAPRWRRSFVVRFSGAVAHGVVPAPRFMQMRFRSVLLFYADGAAGFARIPIGVDSPDELGWHDAVILAVRVADPVAIFVSVGVLLPLRARRVVAAVVLVRAESVALLPLVSEIVVVDTMVDGESSDLNADPAPITRGFAQI